MKQASPRANYLNNPISWRFSFDLYFMFEIDVGAIDLVMPPWCNLLEIRPGVGLLAVGLTEVEAGAVDGIDAFQEVSWTIAVEPDLSRGMPTPKLAFMTGNVMSNHKPFLEHAAKVDKMPAYYSPSLRGTCDAHSFSGSFEDDDGPIVTMASSNRTPPEFRKRTFWGQQSSVYEGENYFQAWTWTGSIFEHQQGHKGGILHPHPVFRGIDVAGLGDRCYVQMLAEPGVPITVTFHEPVLQRRRGCV